MCLTLQLLFVTINSDEEDHDRILEFFGMKKSEVPAMRLIRLEEDMAKYKPPTSDLDADSIKSFVQSFLDGKLKVCSYSSQVKFEDFLDCKNNLMSLFPATPALSGPPRGLGQEPCEGAGLHQL